MTVTVKCFKRSQAFTVINNIRPSNWVANAVE